jgi:hypothetical protein
MPNREDQEDFKGWFQQPGIVWYSGAVNAAYPAGTV